MRAGIDINADGSLNTVGPFLAASASGVVMTTPIIDWDDPEARIDLIRRVGVARYNELLLAHQRASVIETVNGYDIRAVRTQSRSRWL